MKRGAFRRGWFLGTTLALAPLAFGQTATETAKTDLQAHALLREVAGFYAGLETVVVEATLTVKNLAPGQDQALSNTFSITLQRPGRLAMAARGDATEKTVVSDGQHLYTYDPKTNEYKVEVPPPDPAAIVGLAGSGIVRVGTQVMAELFRPAPYAVLMEQVQGQHYLDQEDVYGKPHHHIKLVHEEIDWEMWIDVGEKPLVSKVTVDVAKVLKSAGQDAMPLEMTIAYKSWVINGELSGDAFVFVPPEGAERVDPTAARAAPTSPSELRGRPAPPFRLTLLDGGALDLADHRGKHIVILDFWASWCGPCRQAMPIYSKVAKAYKDKGVVFYGVNLAETPEVARAFLEKTGIQCAVALDANNEVAGQYHVASIPTSVIIDRDGVVAFVHVGFSPNLEAKLREELDTLVDKG